MILVLGSWVGSLIPRSQKKPQGDVPVVQTHITIARDDSRSNSLAGGLYEKTGVSAHPPTLRTLSEGLTTASADTKTPGETRLFSEAPVHRSQHVIP